VKTFYSRFLRRNIAESHILDINQKLLWLFVTFGIVNASTGRKVTGKLNFYRTSISPPFRFYTKCNNSENKPYYAIEFQNINMSSDQEIAIACRVDPNSHNMVVYSDQGLQDVVDAIGITLVKNSIRKRYVRLNRYEFFHLLADPNNH